MQTVHAILVALLLLASAFALQGTLEDRQAVFASPAGPARTVMAEGSERSLPSAYVR